jgi:hypothetical protein
MIRDVLKKATKGAITWVGTKFNIPAPITAGASDIAESLFTKQSGGGDFQLIDTSVQPQRFGRRMGFINPSGSRGARDYADVVNPETLNATWDSRLSEYYTKTYKVARTTTLKA